MIPDGVPLGEGGRGYPPVNRRLCAAPVRRSNASEIFQLFPIFLPPT